MNMQPALADKIAAMPKGLPRANGPELLAAIGAALAAQQAGMAKGVPLSILIADAVGATVVLISGDGAGVRSQLIAQTKANIVAKYKIPSGDVEQNAKIDQVLHEAAIADPNIGILRSGGFPIFRDGVMFAIVAVSGGSLKGDMTLDDACALIAVRYLEAAAVTYS